MYAQAHVVLLNGWQVPACSEAEAMFIYDEVVNQQCYLQDGIQISNGDVVIDVGANIGQCKTHWSEAPMKSVCLACFPEGGMGGGGGGGGCTRKIVVVGIIVPPGAALKMFRRY